MCSGLNLCGHGCAWRLQEGRWRGGAPTACVLPTASGAAAAAGRHQLPQYCNVNCSRCVEPLIKQGHSRAAAQHQAQQPAARHHLAAWKRLSYRSCVSIVLGRAAGAPSRFGSVQGCWCWPSRCCRCAWRSASRAWRPATSPCGWRPSSPMRSSCGALSRSGASCGAGRASSASASCTSNGCAWQTARAQHPPRDDQVRAPPANRVLATAAQGVQQRAVAAAAVARAATCPACCVACAVAVVSNHMGWPDILIHMARYFPAFVARDGTQHLPMIGLIRWAGRQHRRRGSRRAAHTCARRTSAQCAGSAAAT